MHTGANQDAAVTIRAMRVNKSFLIGLVAAIFIAGTGCSPNFNWREVQGTEPSYTVLLPAKPSSHSRVVDLDGLKVTMTMTAAEPTDDTAALRERIQELEEENSKLRQQLQEAENKLEQREVQ